MSVVAIHQTSKPHELAREINKLTDGIERDSRLAGQHLATLKDGKPPGITWEHYLKDCGVKVSARHADRLIEGFRGPSRKPPTPKSPPSDIVSEPIIDIADEFPDRKTLSTPDRKVLYEQGCQLLERMDRPTRRKFFAYQERKYLANFDGAVDGLRRRVDALERENTKLRQKLDPGRCEWMNDDGGRAAAGYEPEGDCVIRAIAVATEKPYVEVREALKKEASAYAKRYPRAHDGRSIKRSRNGGYNAKGAYVGYLKSLGWEYTEPKDTYLRADMLPPGRLVVLVNRHAVAVIDGIIHDSYDSGGRSGKVRVEGYWTAPKAVTA